jgi:hypothetical protein
MMLPMRLANTPYLLMLCLLLLYHPLDQLALRRPIGACDCACDSDCDSGCDSDVDSDNIGGGEQGCCSDIEQLLLIIESSW